MFGIRSQKRTKTYRTIKYNIIFAAFAVALCIASFLTVYQHLSNTNHLNSQSSVSRHLLQDLGGASIDDACPSDDCDPDAEACQSAPSDPYKIACADYPQDLFTEDALKSGALILHVVGLFYMFLGIAIVCDEFFVPAIEEIVDTLGLSPDVAGATFMAAGGSAPELFTSFFGTFVSKSAVGFGTIVGSAVFNVLFVIGCCAIFSSGDLVLTWYPFARDSIYYCVSLCILAGFFADFQIYWYEAIILFVMYFGYVLLMVNNAKLYEWLDRTFIKTPPRERAKTEAEQLRPPQSIGTFSVSLFKMMTADAKLSDIAGIHMVARIKGDVRATFKQVDTDKSGYIEKDELEVVLQKLGGVVTEEEVEKCLEELDENQDGRIDFQEFSRWYLKSENRIEADVSTLFNKFDHDGNGYIEIDELEALVTSCQGDPDNPPSTDEVENARKILDANNDNRISREEFLNWYKQSKFFQAEKQRRNTIVESEEKEEEGGIDLTFPENTKGRIMYILSAPLMYSMYYTVPDVRKERWKSWWAVAFIGSILWLGAYSYFMVWWATVIGRILGIPDNIMGLTVLAAGTSVPDLLTSIIVAREGHGDMAVSSSIGSNIFDVLVGLPLPWVFYTIFNVGDNGHKIIVQAETLVRSILILFGMIACVLAIIWCSKWRMTKTLGYSMFVLYLLFCAQDIALYYAAQ